jgi:hypothetical protein
MSAIFAIIGHVGCGDAWTTVNGEIVDENGQAIKGANVRLQVGSDADQPWIDKSETDSNGKFHARVGHAPGKVTLILKVSKPGFKPYQETFSSPPQEQERKIVLVRDEMPS